MNRIPTGILSFGMSGKIFHAPFLDLHEGFELKAVTERTQKKAHHQYPNIKSHDSVDALIHDQEIELVVVNTPNNTHFEFAMQAIQAGKHVLVEKPFAVTSAQAKELFDEAKKHNLLALPYQNRRYDSDFLSVKQVLESGKIGQPIEAHIRFDRYKPELGAKLFKEQHIPGAGLAYDLGSHLLDGAISLFGMPSKWRKNLSQFRAETQVDDYAHIHLTYPEGLQVFITTSLLVAQAGPSFVLNGTKGSYQKHRTDVQEAQLLAGMSLQDPDYGIEDETKTGVLTVIDQGGKLITEEITSEKSSYLQLFEDVYQSIRAGKPYLVTEAQIIQQLEILEA